MSYTNPEVTFFPRDAITRATQEFDAPFFFYSEKRIRENCQRVLNTFQEHFPTVQPLYAVKANSNPHILRIIADEGFGFDCSSQIEMEIVERLHGFGMYTGNYLSQQEIQRVATQQKIILNLDDISAINFLDAQQLPEIISFRVNPGITIQSNMPSLQVAGSDAKFGVPHEEIVEAYKKARALGIKRFGIHMMTGSNQLESEYFSTITNRLFEIMINIREHTGIEMEFINLGGGLGVPYEPQQESLNLKKMVKQLRKTIDYHCKAAQYAEPQLYLEPGRYITADAGWLVATVQAKKSGYKKYAGLNVSTNAMPRPAIYGAYHHISALTDEPTSNTPINIVGQICENNDFLGKDRILPNLNIGDTVIIHNCGAHAFVMSHNYNGTLKPAEIVWTTNDSFQVIRRAETIDDYLKTIV